MTCSTWCLVTIAGVVVDEPGLRTPLTSPTNIRYRLVPESGSVEGIIVTSNFLTGRVPRTEIHLGSGEVVQVEGTARTREAVNRATARGGVMDVSFGVHPRVIPMTGEVDGFSPGMWSHYAAAQRSGVVSVLLGSPSERPRPLPLSLFFALINAGGPRIIVDLGHLTALGDEEVRQLAEQLGSLEDLLEVSGFGNGFGDFHTAVTDVNDDRTTRRIEYLRAISLNEIGARPAGHCQRLTATKKWPVM